MSTTRDSFNHSQSITLCKTLFQIIKNDVDKINCIKSDCHIFSKTQVPLSSFNVLSFLQRICDGGVYYFFCNTNELKIFLIKQIEVNLGLNHLNLLCVKQLEKINDLIETINDLILLDGVDDDNFKEIDIAYNLLKTLKKSFSQSLFEPLKTLHNNHQHNYKKNTEKLKEINKYLNLYICERSMLCDFTLDKLSQNIKHIYSILSTKTLKTSSSSPPIFTSTLSFTPSSFITPPKQNKKQICYDCFMFYTEEECICKRKNNIFSNDEINTINNHIDNLHKQIINLQELLKI